jgi:hypothetical protein
MPRFLDTTGQPSIAIAICDRCKMKRYFSSLGPDRNFPGLRVCDQGCRDELDPYRLPARKTERINLRFPRPDVSVADTNQYLVNDASGAYLISTEQNTQTPENNGNIDTIEP